jgi:aspartyl-tRNA(Asn)/glutamyl-tRNA(Gln) amidotransferase subunit C
MSLSPDDVRRIARLARIALQPAESAAVTERLNGVLAMVEQIRRVDTSGIEPMAHAQDVVQPLREDSVTETDQRERYQAVAPAVEDGLYLVPKVVE